MIRLHHAQGPSHRRYVTRLKCLRFGCSIITCLPLKERGRMNVNDQSCDDSLCRFFFPPHVHASTRTCLIFEGEGVGTTDRRVWHMRTFPGATDVRPTHSPKGRGRHSRPQSVAYEDLFRSNRHETHTLSHPTQVDQWPWPLCRALVLGTSLRKMMNKHECTKCKNVY